MTVIPEPGPDDPYGEKWAKMWEDEVRGVPDPDVVHPEIVTREQWGAIAPKETKDLNMPAQVILFQQTESEECHTREECITFLQKQQLLDMNENEMPDIQFNFYIGSDKTIYEGRGWFMEANKKAEDEQLEGRSLDVAYIGNYEDVELSDEMVTIGSDFVKYGKKMKYLHEHINITTYWEGHIENLRPKYKANPLDLEGPALPPATPKT